MTKACCFLGVLVLLMSSCDKEKKKTSINNANNANNINNTNNINNINSSGPVCGNGIKEEGEQCDQSDLGGLTCETVGNFGGGDLLCNSACQYDTSGCFPMCTVNNWEECDFLAGFQCCPNNDMPSECFYISADAGAICLQTCTEGPECGYLLTCYQQIGNLCFPKYCGGAAGGPPISQPCQLNPGRDGYCVGMGTAMDDQGLCLENGTAQHGEACYQDPEESPMGKILTESEKAEICEAGICVGMDAEGNPTNDGVCIALCDPNAVYAGVMANTDPEAPWTTTDTCPENSNCVNFSSLDKNEFDDEENPNPEYLFRSADMGICYPTVPGLLPGAGVVSCDLRSARTVLSGETCPPTPVEIFGFPVTNLETTCQVLTDGALIGACQPAETVPNRKPLGEICDPAHERTLYFVVPVPAAECVDGTICQVADPLHAEDMATAETRCMKPCHAGLGLQNNPDCEGIVDDGGNPTVCLTVSRYYTDDHQLPRRLNNNGVEVEETAPSPLGFCVPSL